MDINRFGNIAVGRILNIDRQSRMFSIINDQNPSSVIRFSVPISTRTFDIFGRQMDFGRLVPGLRVRVRHASFMTPSIPPQTTAFDIRVIR